MDDALEGFRILGLGLGLTAAAIACIVATGGICAEGIVLTLSGPAYAGGTTAVTTIVISGTAVSGAGLVYNNSDSGGGSSSPDTNQVLARTSTQLRAKFKHASDFGVKGNYNTANAAAFSAAINRHINAPGTQIIRGTYRG